MVIDSHTLLWWLDGDARLSAEGRRIMDNEAAGPDRLVVSAVTFWELRLKEIRSKLTPKRPVNTWPKAIRSLPRMRIEEVTLGDWLCVAEMNWENRDPADRIIAATAIRLGMPVVTVDEKFHGEVSPVEVVW